MKKATKREPAAANGITVTVLEVPTAEEMVGRVELQFSGLKTIHLGATIRQLDAKRATRIASRLRKLAQNAMTAAARLDSQASWAEARLPSKPAKATKPAKKAAPTKSKR